MSLTQDDFVIPLDVSKTMLDTYVRNCLAIKGSERLMLFAGDQKVEPWNRNSKHIRRYVQGGKI